jgi:CheY-like chemotaxis protein
VDPKRHVVVVDDEPDLRETTAQVLEMAGHTVVIAAEGADALRRIEEGFAPDVVVLDLLMPGMDGPLFLEKLRERLPTPPRVVVVTGLHSDHLKRLLEVSTVLFKPYEPRDLLAAVAGRGTVRPGR